MQSLRDESQDIEPGRMLGSVLARAFKGQITQLLPDIQSRKMLITFRQVTDQTIGQLDTVVTTYLEAHPECALDVIVFDQQGRQRWALRQLGGWKYG